MTLTLYLDHDSSYASLVEGLQLNQIDVVTSRETGNERASDEQQLAFAASMGRVLYTANLQDYARLYADWARRGMPHSGIIVRTYQQMRLGLQLRGLLAICKSRTPSDIANQLIYLESWLGER